MNMHAHVISHIKCMCTFMDTCTCTCKTFWPYTPPSVQVHRMQMIYMQRYILIKLYVFSTSPVYCNSRQCSVHHPHLYIHVDAYTCTCTCVYTLYNTVHVHVPSVIRESSGWKTSLLSGMMKSWKDSRRSSSPRTFTAWCTMSPTRSDGTKTFCSFQNKLCIPHTWKTVI